MDQVPNFVDNDTSLSNRVVAAWLNDVNNMRYRTPMPLRLADLGAVITQDASTPSVAIQNANSLALNTALRAIISVGSGKLIIPSGYLHLNDVHEISTFVQASTGVQTPNWGLVIDIEGQGNAVLVQNHATLPLIRLATTGSLKVRMRNLGLFGRGSTTMGTLLEVIGNGLGTFENLTFHGTGGIGMFLLGSERISTNNLKFFYCRQAIVESGGAANNENYFFNTQIVSPGFTLDPITSGNQKSYSINVSGDGVHIITSGNYYSEHHTAIQLQNIVNNRFIGGSIKVTDNIGGFAVRGSENLGIDNIYFEGFGLGANPSLIFYGQAEATTLPSGVAAAGTLTVPVASSLWFGRESSDSRFDSSFAGVSAVIYDPAAVTVFEVVTLQCFRGGNAILTARGQAGGIAAQAWAAGCVLREYFGNVGNSNNTQALVQNCHLESYQTVPGTCALQASAQFGYHTGEAIVGIEYDEFHTASAMLQGSATVQFLSNDTRAFSLTNGGKVQTWVSSTIDLLDKTTTQAGFIAIAQSNSAAAFYTNTSVRGPDFHFNTAASNGVSIERQGAGISLGGGGRVVYRMMGETGIGLTENTQAALLMATFDIIGGDFGLKIRAVNNGGAGAWDYTTALGDGWCKVNNFYIRQGMKVSADRGDAAQTLTVGTDEPTQRWATALGADRAVTLSTTGAQNGNKWHIVRTTASTGAFNLNVGTGPLKALATGQWCDVEYNGSAWMLTAFGSL